MRTGTTVAHYEIGELLGRGGMGDVYRARDTRLERPVALKFLGARYVAAPEAKARFIREAKSASALDHPNICTIHDFGETEDGDLYMVMALYEGRTLEERLEAGEAFTPERTESILRQLGQALKRAHAAGIVHRDLKPGNVMVGPDDAVRLLDFGIAKLQSEQALTKTGATLGTAAYMSPEQASADPVTTATDVWSLGVIGYRMLTGRLPFGGDTPLATLNQILTSDPTPVRELAPACPEPLAELIEAALAKEIRARPADGAAFVARLDGTQSHGAAPGNASPPTGRIALAAGAALVVVVVGWQLWGGTGPASSDPAEARGGGAPESSDDVLAVVPFTVTGTGELAYLAEGMMDLLAGRLDGAGPLRTVDPRVIAAGLDLEEGEGVGVAEGAELARRSGAGSFVTGQLIGLPGSLSLSARVHVVETGEARPIVTVEGSADSLFVLVDRLASGLLETSISGQNARIARRAAATSNSLAATRAFLEGEQFHRAGQFDSAAVAYNRAVSIDSTFALAHLMKSMNNAFTYETDDLDAAERAMRFSDGLPERDRSLISAFLDQQSGELRSAEEKYLNHLRRWPDEVKAMLQLGRTYRVATALQGHSPAPAREWFERALELEPGSVQARFELARVSAMDRRFGELPEHARAMERVAPGTERALRVRLLATMAGTDPAPVDAFVATYRDLPLLERLYGTIYALRFAEDPQLAERVLQLEPEIAAAETLSIEAIDYQPDEVERLGDYTISLVVLKDLMFGRYDAVLDFLRDETRPGYTAPAWIIADAEMIASSVLPVDVPLLERTLERLAMVDPATRMDLHFERLHDVFTPEVAALERDALRARLLIQLGRLDEARTIRDEVAAGPTYRGFASLREDVVGLLDAELLIAGGDEEGALEVLRALEFQVSSTANAVSTTWGTHARFLRAELERRYGDPEVARRHYEGLVGTFASFDKFYLARAYEQLGLLAEERSDLEDAIYWTEKLVQIRQSPDPEFEAEAEAARARLVRVRGG